MDKKKEIFIVQDTDIEKIKKGGVDRIYLCEKETSSKSILSQKVIYETNIQLALNSPTGTDELGDSGLGIFKMKLSNGVSIWWHGGTIPGFLTFAGATLGGKHTLAVN